MTPIQQLTNLNTLIENYVTETGDDTLKNIFIRCVTKGDDHEFQIVKKNLWTRVKLFFSSDETKNQYRIVNNIGEIEALFGKITAEEGVNLGSLEESLNKLIVRVLRKDPFKGLTTLNFVATFKQKKGEQDLKVAAVAQKEADEKRLQEHELAEQKRLREEEEARQKQHQEELAQRKREIQEENQKVEPVLREKIDLYERLLETKLDSSQALIPLVTDKLAEVETQMDALKVQSKYMFFSESTLYGLEGSPQALLLASLKKELQNLNVLLKRDQKNPEQWAKELQKATPVLHKIEDILLANRSDDKDAKRREALLVANQFLKTLGSFKQSEATYLIEFHKDLNKEGADIETLLRTLRTGTKQVKDLFPDSSEEKKLFIGFIAFVNNFLPK